MGKQKIVIPGGGGFIGRHVTRHFAAKGWDVVVLSRQHHEHREGFRFVWWDGANLDAWADELDGAAAVIVCSADKAKELMFETFDVQAIKPWLS